MTNTKRIKINHNTSFKYFFNKFIFINYIEKMWFLNLRYKVKNSGLKNKKLNQ